MTYQLVRQPNASSTVSSFHRADYEAVLDTACDAWNALAGETGRLASLTAYPYLLRSELQ